MTTRPASKAIRFAARNITTAPAHLDRLIWLRENAPEIAAFVEAKAQTLIHVSANEYPRTAMQLFSRLVMGR